MNIDVLTGAAVVALQVIIVFFSFKLGSWSTLYRVSSRLRQLPLDQAEFELLQDSLGLDDNPLDRRTPGEE